MLTPDLINSVFHAEGIGIYETRFCFDEDIDVALKSENIHELVRLAKENSVKSIFYGYEYADINDYLITDDDMIDISTYAHAQELIYNDYLQYFHAEKTHFNQKILSYDFSTPIALSVYCILNGIQVGILQKNPWDIALPSKNDFLSNLEKFLDEMYLTTIEREQAQNESKRREIFEKILKHLDNTDDWHSCTNQRLRRSYCLKLIDEYERKYNVRLSTYEVSDALEMRWNAFKANKSK